MMTHCLKIAVTLLMLAAAPALGAQTDSTATAGGDTLGAAAVDSMLAAYGEEEYAADGGSKGVHKLLKEKFLEGNALFMSLVAMALVIGLAICIERIIYLALSDIDDRRLMSDIEKRIAAGDTAGARQLCRDTRGPVASICCQALCRIDGDMAEIERSVQAYGAVQVANLERGCSWIRLFIAIAPSLGFLGTVIGMAMAFDQIQQAGDISPTIVASGMKVALFTTIFGIIVAVVLQLFYNYILSRIDHLTERMEDCSITLFDIISAHKHAAATAAGSGKPTTKDAH